MLPLALAQKWASWQCRLHFPCYLWGHIPAVHTPSHMALAPGAPPPRGAETPPKTTNAIPVVSSRALRQSLVSRCSSRLSNRRQPENGLGNGTLAHVSLYATLYVRSHSTETGLITLICYPASYHSSVHQIGNMTDIKSERQIVRIIMDGIVAFGGRGQGYHAGNPFSPF